jgi:two-component system, cell cycle sensor histidine kinase and response regulator CckA
VFSESRIPVLGGPGDTLGYVRSFSHVSSDDRSGKLIRNLIGSEAVMLVGNEVDSIWTDLNTRVAGPVGAGAPGVAKEIVGADGTHWIGALTAVPRVPWRVWVAQPTHAVMAPARAFLYRIGGIALALLILGAIAATMLSTRLVAPLVALTRAAEAIATGDYSQRVAVVGSDEMGRLAGTFNLMASEIQTASLNLEQQQAELEMQQAELEVSNQELQETLTFATEAQESAERARVRVAAVLAASLDCIITIDERGRVLEFNPAAEQTFGYKAADVIGKFLHDLIIPPSHREAHQHGLARAMASGETPILGVRIELPAMRADGSEFPVEAAITRVPVDGPPIYTGFLRDLSQRKALEAQLQQSQKMDAVGRLAGGVAHDFNNILTVILSYTELLLADYTGNGTVRSDIGHVRTAAERAAALTRQLLAFSRKQVMHPTVLDVNVVVGELHAMLARVIREDVRLELRLGGGLWPVCVDRSQLEQVLMNLAVNARDAMPDGGSLVIETSNAVLDATYVLEHTGAMPGPHVVLSVTDSGVGMDAATRERAFEPFFTTKGPGKGTGLGLSTVYGIVKQSGGSIWLYSEPGRGTSFKAYFPRHAGSIDGPAPAEKTPIAAQFEATVLLVEDDAEVRIATRRLLERFGYAVVEAPEAETALAMVRGGEPHIDLVLSDAVMPGMSGLALAERIAAERPGLSLVLMSGYSEEAINRGSPLTANAVFLEKPFSVHALSRAVAEALGRERA